MVIAIAYVSLQHKIHQLESKAVLDMNSTKLGFSEKIRGNLTITFIPQKKRIYYKIS